MTFLVYLELIKAILSLLVYSSKSYMTKNTYVIWTPSTLQSISFAIDFPSFLFFSRPFCLLFPIPITLLGFLFAILGQNYHLDFNLNILPERLTCTSLHRYLCVYDCIILGISFLKVLRCSCSKCFFSPLEGKYLKHSSVFHAHHYSFSTYNTLLIIGA